MPRVKAQPQKRADTGTIIQVNRDIAAQGRQNLYNETKAQFPELVRASMPQMMSIDATSRKSRKSPSVRVSKKLKIKLLDKLRKKGSKSPKCPVGCVPAPKKTKGQQMEARMLNDLEREAAAYDSMYTDVDELSELASPKKKSSRKASPSRKSPSRKTSRKSPCTAHKSSPFACNADSGCYVSGAKQQYCRKKSPSKTYPMATLTPALPTAMAMYGPPMKNAPVSIAKPLAVGIARPK